MDAQKIQPVILAGGAGSRLWPLSTPERPKPFLPLTGTETLLEETIKRVSDTALYAAPLIITQQAYSAYLPKSARILLEPEARNTAPAIALAALQHPGDTLLLVLPADHIMADNTALRTAIESATPLAAKGEIVTFAITPTYAETNYGYIEKGDMPRVASFTEKPDAATAERYLASGNYGWNSGIFLFRADSMIDAFQQHAPDILAHCRTALDDPQTFAQNPSLSIDYAIMEKAENIAMVELNCGWSDLGNWDSLIAHHAPQAEHVERPWGWYRTLFELEDKKIKEVLVNPNARMSLQRHQHRSEHWLVLEGTAQIHCAGAEHRLQVGGDFIVPKGATHRLSNPGDTPLRIIEIQQGEYLGEDDIERLEDDFGRE